MISDDFEAAYPALAVHVRRAYGVATAEEVMAPPFVGDLDGATIFIDPREAAESKLFLVGHLLGHTVQWNLDPALVTLGAGLTPPMPAEVLQELLDYEEEAFRYGLYALQGAGLGALEGWFCDYSDADRRYLEHFYRTGVKRPFEEFRSEGRSCMTALPIPPFEPAVRRRRSAAGVVL